MLSETIQEGGIRMITLKQVNCCKRPMRLVHIGADLDTNYTCVFQCNKCGLIKIKDYYQN